MSGAKCRMRHKKMKNQPSNVTYFSSLEYRNGGSVDGDSSDSKHMRGPSLFGGAHQASGWQRERQGCGFPQDQALPKYITASLFAKARAAEVNTMLRAVTKTTGSCHVFGALPKHMRRRAMSHNIKRLPCRLREVAHSMLEKSQKAGQREKKHQSKTKSRRARRRHGNLLQEFNRRQRKNKWLETHIWHAKRFHMLKRWGYCLGDRPTYKSYRASYRAMSFGCLLQDLSYYCCLELQGPEEQLLSALSKLTNKETGPTFAAALCLSGQREGSIMLYRPNQYPCQPLGPAHFLWRPCSAESTHRQLWIWVHPTLKQDLLPELQAVCQCFEVVSPAVEKILLKTQSEPSHTALASLDPISEPHPRKKSKREGDGNNVNPSIKMADDAQSHLNPVSWKSFKTDIVINDLSMEILRYRLIGPLSHSVLTEALLPASNNEVDSKVSSSPLWWPEQCENKYILSLHQQQGDVFHMLRGLYSTAELPVGCVLGLTVDDPRMACPQKPEKVAPDLQSTHNLDEGQRRNLILRGIPAPCAQSALWDQSVRDNVRINKMSDQDLNRMKRELLVPGSRLPTPPQGRVPILLVHQAGKQLGEENHGWGSGWDLLLPKGWGMAFWTPLVYRGVRIGGLQMSLKHTQIKGVPHFPYDYPDCPAGAQAQEHQEVELLEMFKRRPPSKRTNYIKYGCLAPFRCPWQQLAEEWEEIEKQESTPVKIDQVVLSSGGTRTSEFAFSVLRSRKVLRQLSVWSWPSSVRTQRMTRGCLIPSFNRAVSASLQMQWRRCLVWVRVCMLSKGLPTLHAMLCIPTVEDLQQLCRNPQCSGPEEARHKDHLQHLLKKKNKKHKASPHFTPVLIKEDNSLAIKKEQDSGNEEQLSIPTSLLKDCHPVLNTSLGKDPDSNFDIEPSSVIGFSESSLGLVRGLWPEPLPSVSSHCSRMTLGWVTQGDFSMATGGGEALGFVSLTGLMHMILSQPVDQRGIVLLRNPCSLQYRYARLHIEA